MNASPEHTDPFEDNGDHKTPFFTQEYVHSNQGQPTVSSSSRSPGNSAPQDLDGPPLYQHPNFVSDEKNNITPALSQQHFNPAAVGSITPAPAHTMSSASEAEWYETLRELQANLADLRAARSRASRFAVLARATPQCFRPRRLLSADESAREVRVLEELILAGMRRLTYIHTDPLVQAEWDSHAEEFQRTQRSASGVADAVEGSIALTGAEDAANGDLEGARAGRLGLRAARLITKADKDTALIGLSKGVGILLFTPVALAGAAAFGAGAMLYGSGKIIVELGHFLTFGKLR